MESLLVKQIKTLLYRNYLLTKRKKGQTAQVCFERCSVYSPIQTFRVYVQYTPTWLLLFVFLLLYIDIKYNNQ